LNRQGHARAEAANSRDEKNSLKQGSAEHPHKDMRSTLVGVRRRN
jgi:hypothetical protein